MKIKETYTIEFEDGTTKEVSRAWLEDMYRELRKVLNKTDLGRIGEYGPYDWPWKGPTDSIHPTIYSQGV